MTVVNPLRATNAIKASVATVTGINGVGDTDSPHGIAPPFVEMSMLPAGRDAPGDWAQLGSLMYLNYQFIVVGQSREQAEDLGSDVMDHLFAQNPTTHAWVNALNPTDHVVAGRELTSVIGHVDSGRSKGFIFHARFLVHRTT